MKVKPKKKDTKTKQMIFKCPHCNKQFSDKSSWHCHVSLHTTEEPYKCEICDYKCKIKKYLSRHMKKAHTKPTGHQCNVCGKCFHFYCKLRDHMRVHTGEKPFSCDVCGKSFSSTYSLSGHKLIHTGEKPFQCSYCDYACRDNSTIRKHEERHMGISKDFPCSICKKNFKKKETLQIHVDEVHFDLDTRKFPCEQCNKVFKTKGTLNIHLNTVHNKSNRVTCEICGVQGTKNNINAHMRRHIDLRPYKCSYKPCGRRFKDKGDLKKHSLIHYPDRQHLCKVCDRRFPRRSRLTKHTLLHHNKNHVQCDYCGVLFSTKMHVSRHIKKEHGPNAKKYICDHCGLVTYSRQSIIMHLKYGHGSENDSMCQICKKNYVTYLGLKEHYLKNHNIKYSLLKDVKIKDEPYEELEITHEPTEFMYEVEVQKQELSDDLSDDQPLKPATSPTYTIDADTITYSKKVLSEDISRSLLERDKDMPGNEFDDFFIGHVLKKPDQIIEPPKQIVDEKKKEKVDKCLEKLLTEIRSRKQCMELEKLRRQYNRRIKMATNKANKKEQKVIRYFKKPEEINEIPDSNNDASNKSNDATNNDNISNDEHGNNNIIDQETDGNIDKGNDRTIADDPVIKDKVNDEGDHNNDEDKDQDIDDDKDDDSDYKASDMESDGDVNTNGKLKFNTHQCYICFKLFKTKSDLKRHCRDHFDICNEKMLKKCPFCGYVTNLQIQKHIKLVHKMTIDIPYAHIKERDTQNGSKYVFEIDKNCDLEIIPSVSNLNKIASMKIDEKNRESKNIFMGKTKLVKKGNDWVVEKQAVSVNNEYLLPEFTEEEYQNLKSIGESYLERIKSLSVLAKKRGGKILYPCEGCDKICLTLSALKLHSRKHEANPKAYRPKVWINRIVNKGKNKTKKNKKKYVNNKKNDDKTDGKIYKNHNKINNNKINNRKLERIDINSKVVKDKIDNRFADPNPVRNKHKCDKKLIEFYKKNIKGGDIEFWQFLKIFNKMSRENVNDFKDLENRYDFGMHKLHNGDKSTDLEATTNEITEPIIEINETNSKKVTKNKKKIAKKAFTRAIMISKKEYLRRIEIKNQMRKRIEESKI